MEENLIEVAQFSKDANGLAPHRHHSYEMIFLKKGELFLKVDRKEYVAKAPALIFLNKLEQHWLCVKGREYERYWVCLSSVQAEKWIREERLLTVFTSRPESFCHVLETEEISDRVEEILFALVEEMKTPLPYTKHRQSALILDLLVTVYRKKPEMFSSENRKSVAVIRGIQARFEREPAEKYNLANLAKEYGMTACYFSHLFRRVTGYAPMKYLTMCRLSEARRLLQETDDPITEVVFATGFADCSNFSRLFKKEVGVSPTAWRKKAKSLETAEDFS